MKETKLSLLRSFGTEQFSMTVTFEGAVTEKELNGGIEKLNAAVFKMLQDTESRAIQEREVLAQSSQARAASIEKLNVELAKETESKKALQVTVDATNKFNKTNKK